MKKVRFLAAMILLVLTSAAHGQTFTQVQWGINKAASPSPISVYSNGSWWPIGTLATDGTFTLSGLGSGVASALRLSANSAGGFATLPLGNSYLATMAANTIKCNATSGVTFPTDCTGTQTTALLNVMVGDSGSGGTKGLVPAPSAGDAASLKFLKADGTWALTSKSMSVRQTVMTGPIDNTTGIPAYLPSTSASLSLTTTSVSSIAPLVVTATQIGGPGGNQDLVYSTTSNLTWTGLAANTTNYLYIDAATGATGSTTLAPNYVFLGTPSASAGQFTFLISKMQGYVGNGTTFSGSSIVFVGEAVTNLTTVTSTVAYMFNGYYESAYTATLPSAGTAVSKNSNIGYPGRVRLVIECTTADAGFSVGDQVEGASVGTTGASYFMPVARWSTRNAVGMNTGNGAAPWIVAHKSTGAQTALTLANWKYKLIAERGW